MLLSKSKSKQGGWFSRLGWIAAAVAAIICAFAAPLLRANDLTAFQLIAEGDKHVGEDAKGKVAEIHSDKSVASLVPKTWFVVYFDPDATFKATQVKFVGGVKTEVKRPNRLFGMTAEKKSMDRAKIKVDSDKALEIAQKESVLEKLTLTNTQFKLEDWKENPTWRIRLWAAKLRTPAEVVDLGEIFINAEDGKEVNIDLHINRVE